MQFKVKVNRYRGLHTMWEGLNAEAWVMPPRWVVKGHVGGVGSRGMGDASTAEDFNVKVGR